MHKFEVIQSSNLFIIFISELPKASQAMQLVKNLPASARDTGEMSFTPGSGRFLGEGNGNLPPYFCLGNPTEELGGLQSMGLQRVGQD